MDKNESKRIVETIRNEILPKLPELKGQSPETIEALIDNIVSTNTTPEQKDEIMNSVILTIAMPEQDPEKPWEKPSAGVIKKDGESRLKTLANDISKGKNSAMSKESGKRIRFTVPFAPNELESLGKGEPAKNYIREKIKSAAAQAQIDLGELDKAQAGINFKNAGTRAASIKTTGRTLIEALTEIIYVSVAQEMNPDQVKGACEQNMGTASNTGMQAGNMIDDMINGTGDEVERTQEGFTFSAG